MGDDPYRPSPERLTTDAARIQLAEVLAGIANELPPDDSAPFDDQDQVLTWMGGLLVGLDDETPAKTVRAVMWGLNGPVLRVRAWRGLEDGIVRAYQSTTPTWYDVVMAALVDDAAASFLDHLKQGDQAVSGYGVGYQVHFLLSHEADQLRAAVRGLLELKDVDLSVLASRLVSARTIAGIKADWQLSDDFDQQTFNRLAPPGDDPWYDEPVQDVDIRDLSWANRRKFAAGRVRPPPPRPPGADPG